MDGITSYVCQGSLDINPELDEYIFGNTETYLHFQEFHQNCYIAGRNYSWWGTKTYLSYTIDNMAADVVARASAVMVLY